MKSYKIELEVAYVDVGKIDLCCPLCNELVEQRVADVGEFVITKSPEARDCPRCGERLVLPRSAMITIDQWRHE